MARVSPTRTFPLGNKLPTFELFLHMFRMFNVGTPRRNLFYIYSRGNVRLTRELMFMSFHSLRFCKRNASSLEVKVKMNLFLLGKILKLRLDDSFL